MPATVAERQRRWMQAVAVATTVGGLAVSLLLSAWSVGAYHDDDLTHYQFARWSWQQPAMLLHEWGRPGFTILHFLPARLGWRACRWTSGLLSAATAWLAYLAARRMGLPMAWLTPSLVWVQPLLLQLSCTTLTETALAFYLSGAVYLLVAGRPVGSSAVLSLGLVSRYEAVVLVPLWIAAVWRRRSRWLAVMAIFWAPLLYNALSVILLRQLPAMVFLQARPTDQYGDGHWTAYAAKTLVAFGPAVVCAAVVGAAAVWRREGGRTIAASCVVYVLAETVVWATGSYGSGGYARFLVPLGPLVAILACAGVAGLVSAEARSCGKAVATAAVAMVLAEVAMELELRASDIYWLGRPAWGMRLSAVAVVLVSAIVLWRLRKAERSGWYRWLLPAGGVLMIGLQLGGQVRPLRYKPDQLAIQETVAWLRANGYADRPICTANVWFDYFLDRRRPMHLLPFRLRVAWARPGSIIAWDKRYGPEPGKGIALELLRDDVRRFRLLFRSRATRHEGVFVYVFLRQPPGGPDSSSCRKASSKL